MSEQKKLVQPAKIEEELLKLWEGFGKEKTRACLFNLIVFTRLCSRTDYIRNIVQKVSEKFPCRVIFITEEPEASFSGLKTAVSVVGSGNIACDYIDVGVSKEALEEVPLTILPHLVSDLPVSLLWSEDLGVEHPLFTSLFSISHRVILDSESSDSLTRFAKKILTLKEESKRFDTADLNWARTEGWRELIASLFHEKSEPYLIREVEIVYNARQTEFFCHLKVQSLYLLFWLSSALNWELKEVKKDLSFTFSEQKAKISFAQWEKLGPGTIIKVLLRCSDGRVIECERIKEEYHRVLVKSVTHDQCLLPYQYLLGKAATGQSLIKEIVRRGTSDHYLKMLKNILLLERENIC